MTRSLHGKFFVWFLLAFGATAGATALTVSLFQEARWGQRGREILLAEARTSCAIIEHGLLHDQRAVDMSPLTARFFSDRHTSALLFDAQGYVVAEWLYERTSQETQDLLLPLFYVTMSDGETFDSRPKEAPMVATPCAQGVLGIVAPKFKPAERSPWQTAVPVLVVVLIMWFTSWPLARHLSQPLTELTRTAERFAVGDFSYRTTSRRRDEVGRLTRAFNTMAEAVSTWLEAKQRLLGDVAHELKTPLSRQKVALELLRLDADAKLTPHLDRLTRDTDAIAALIDELLEYARADARFALTRAPLDIAKVIHAAVDELPADAPPVGIAIETENTTLLGDHRVLQRVLHNLLDNAARHGKVRMDNADALGIPSRIDVVVQRDPTHLAIRVRDYGPGVPADQLSNIFEPFVRLDDSRNRRTGGTGLGLAIVQRGVLSHGGTIDASLPTDGGLQIDIRLPI